MPKGKVVTIAVTALIVIMFYDKINSLPLVNKVPRF